MLTSYKRNKSTLDLKNGPIADEKDVRLYKQKKMEEHEIRTYHEEKDINNEYLKWAQNQYDCHKITTSTN